jgi:hypothetical protein
VQKREFYVLKVSFLFYKMGVHFSNKESFSQFPTSTLDAALQMFTWNYPDE